MVAECEDGDLERIRGDEATERVYFDPSPTGPVTPPSPHRHGRPASADPPIGADGALKVEETTASVSPARVEGATACPSAAAESGDGGVQAPTRRGRRGSGRGAAPASTADHADTPTEGSGRGEATGSPIQRSPVEAKRKEAPSATAASAAARGGKPGISGFSQGDAEEVFGLLGLAVDKPTLDVWLHPPGGPTERLLYGPQRGADDPMSLASAIVAMAGSASPAPPNLLPLMAVDDRSLAVVVCQPLGAETVEGVGAVVRWHVDEIRERYQAALLDADAWSYVRSMAEELRDLDRERERVASVTAGYRTRYVAREARPKSFVERPVQLACQNVVIGLTVFAYESSFDGLSVPAWATCEVPHVATHEANRALIGLMLCDAFASGGTMEVRFPRKVPPSIRRYARTLGLFIDDRASGLTPEQARHLFLAVTPMPTSLRDRVELLVADGIVSPERLCFTLMAALWSPLELEFLLATSTRASSILAGGADFRARPARMAESDVCRSARLAGTLFRRLDNVDTAGRHGEVRVFEDTTVGVTWQVLADPAVLVLSDVPDGLLPWQPDGAVAEASGGTLIVMSRANPSKGDVRVLSDLAAHSGLPAVLVVPADRSDVVDCSMPVLVCPQRLSEIDASIERDLLKSRVSRA
jgi:hypothetical protein